MEERIQKLMARGNIGSRRACEALIEQGRVQVNGVTITLGDKADPDRDRITVDGERLRLEEFRPRFIVVNKPKDVLSTNVAPEGDERPTIRELIDVEGHFFTIGRLDADSEGLMVMTNDGETANKLSHPRYEHTKTYKVTVAGIPSQQVIDEWESGVWIDGSRTAPCYIRVIENAKQNTTLRVIMIEGRKRQIRRIAQMLGHPVRRLVRTHIGKLGLGTLRKGAWYELEEEEIEAMLQPADEVKFLRRRNRKARVRPATAPQTGNTSAGSGGTKRPRTGGARKPSGSRGGVPGKRNTTRNKRQER